MSRILFSFFRSGFSVWLKNDQHIIQRLVQGIIQRLVQDSAYYFKMSRELFSACFRIQRTIKKCPACYSASDSVFNVQLTNNQRFLVSGSGFSVQFQNDQRTFQRLILGSLFWGPRLLVWTFWFVIRLWIHEFGLRLWYHDRNYLVFSERLK